MRLEIIPRDPAEVADDATLLVRFNDDVDITAVLRLALTNAPAYGVLPGYEDAGALTVSVFLVTGESEAMTLAAGTGFDRYGLATAGEIRRAGFDVLPTTVLEDGAPLPFADRHADVVVGPYPPGYPAYTAQVPKQLRRFIRQAALPEFERAVRLFDPRRLTPGGIQ
jgi:hypothetical protein